MENHSPRAFANRLELGWDNPQSAGDLSCGKGRPFCYVPVYFCGEVAPRFLAIPNGMETQNTRLFCKRWEQCPLFRIFSSR